MQNKAHGRIFARITQSMSCDIESGAGSSVSSLSDRYGLELMISTKQRLSRS